MHDRLPGVPRAATLRRSAWRNPLLWTLQGWLAMFYVAAGYAKITEPRDMLVVLLGWPAWIDHASLTAIGVIELVAALGVLTPVISWRWFRPVMLLCTGALLLNALVMGSLHIVLRDPGLVAVNAALAVFATLVIRGRLRWLGP